VCQQAGLGRRDWAIAFLVALSAGALRAWALNVPSRPLLDEYWYGRDGCFYWRASAEACGMARLVAPDRDVVTWLARYGELTPEHPPLAKWLIGVPMAVLDYGAGAGRLAPLFAGTLTVLLLYFLVRKAFGSPWIAAGASAGLAIDFPHYIHSRLAMLDVFTALFAVAAFLFVVLDRAQGQRRADHPRHLGWRAMAAAAAGAAAATKLSGGAVVVGVVILVLLWHGEESRAVLRPRRQRLVAPALRALFVIAIATTAYVASYVGRLEGDLLTLPWADQAWLRAWWERQLYMLEFHAAKPTGMSHPWDLPMTSPPLVYFMAETDVGIRQVLLFGNPLMWWGGFVAAGVALFDWVTRRRDMAPGIVITAFLAGSAGWLSLTLTGRTVHLYQAIAMTPFLYLALAYVLARAWNRRVVRTIALAVVLISGVGFVYYLPILNAHLLHRTMWEPRGCSAMALWLSELEGCGLGAPGR
jgi:dolichyl-phosphate-mannose--protein O-mannosyl transferase